ncbi:hypothetical protein J6590_043896 [Homalodisca vitripennis]|nr:hypothetical protein J6590_043896 [Homalodisca vitripennis]
MAKQWATRVIVAFQSACWCIVILLLLSRGLSNLRYSYSVEFQRTANTTVPADTSESGRGYTVGVCLIVVAALMIIASPAIIVARAYDRRRYRSVFENIPKTCKANMARNLKLHGV